MSVSTESLALLQTAKNAKIIPDSANNVLLDTGLILKRVFASMRLAKTKAAQIANLVDQKSATSARLVTSLSITRVFCAIKIKQT